MGQGLRIDYGDGSPVMEITSGIRCPTFCNRVDSKWDQRVVWIENFVENSGVIIMPRSPVTIQYRGTNSIPTIGMLSGWSRDGARIEFDTWWSDGWGRDRLFDLTIMQIMPPSSTNQGLYIRDSTNFTAISDAGLAGYCVWSGEITFRGQWRTPDTRIGRDRYMVFAKWHAPGVVVDFDGENINAKTESDGEGEDAWVTMRVAIFSSGIWPEPGTGLNMFNSAGQCTFSTKSRPFIFNERWSNPSWDWQSINGGMLMLSRYGFRAEVSGGWAYVKHAGAIMSDGGYRISGSVTGGRVTNRYYSGGRRLSGFAVPIIEPMY